jgi:two-component system response regulator FlrC
VLQQAGFDVIEAATAEQAIPLARTAPFQVALIDVHLPGDDGFELCRALRATNPSLPVVLISAVFGTAWARDTAMEAGAIRFVVEPLKPKELIEVVNAAIHGSRDEPRTEWAITDPAGNLVDVSAAVAEMLNVDGAHLRGRSLILFFMKDRSAWQQSVELAARGHIVRREGVLRPRERRVIGVDVELSGDASSGTVRWVFTTPDE